MTEYFNPDTYAVIDKVTGEEVPVQIFIEKAGSEYWEKAYAKTLAEYIGITGSAPNKILAYIIKNKNADNLLIGTIRGLSISIGVSTKALSNLMKLLKDKGFIKKRANGVYFVSPHLLRHGSKNRGAMLLRLWDGS